MKPEQIQRRAKIEEMLHEAFIGAYLRLPRHPTRQEEHAEFEAACDELFRKLEETPLS